MKKFKALKKSQQTIIISVLAVLIVAAGTLTAFAIGDSRAKAAHKAMVEQLTADFTAQSLELTEIQELANQLMDENGFLNADISEDKISEIESKLTAINEIVVEEKYQEDIAEFQKNNSKIKDETAEQLFIVSKRLDKQTLVNSLFKEPALVGNVVSENNIIADDLDIAKLKEIKVRLGIAQIVAEEKAETAEQEPTQIPVTDENSEASAEDNSDASQAQEENTDKTDKVDNDNTNDEVMDKWQITIDTLIASAQAQVNHVENIKNEIAKYIVDNNLVADTELNLDIINNIKSLTEQIKNESIRKPLAEQATQIENLYNEKIRLAAEEQAAAVGGTAEKQEDGTYKVVASDNAEYAVSASGEVTKTKEAPPPPAAQSSGNSGSNGGSSNGLAGSSGGSSGSSSGGNSSSGSSGSGSSSGGSNGGYTSIESDMHYGGEIGYNDGDSRENGATGGGNTWNYGDDFVWPEDWG